MNGDTLWWRHRWMEAVYQSQLKPLERLVAAIYADHAHDQRVAWVTLDRLSERSGLSRTQAKMWRRRLVESGFLIQTQKANHHKATVYGLVIPAGQGVGDPTPSGVGLPTPSSTSGGRVTRIRGSDYRPQGVGDPTPIKVLIPVLLIPSLSRVTKSLSLTSSASSRETRD